MDSFRMSRFAITFTLCAIPLFLGSCSSIARGITEAVIDTPKNMEDTRQCEIDGPAFNGIRQSLENENGIETTKILMVHGISSHAPGYSTRFQKKLFEELDLNIVDSEVKIIELESSDITWAKNEPHTLGQLRVSRHTDTEGQRQLIFYELTWSPITEPEKKALTTDSANYEGLKRSSLNASLKSFMNATVPDLLIYTGNGQPKIKASVRQSVCWMLANDWNHIPSSGRHECGEWNASEFSDIKTTDYFFVTHSLGSRITIDTIQNFSHQKEASPNPRIMKVSESIRNKTFTVFMLANQLPLLQMGRDAPEISGETAAYCGQDNTGLRHRMMGMNIIAFSDPNDILSYPVPSDFAQKSLDSRICPSITNVSLNIAPTQTLFDAVSFANPLQAHSGYMEDERVIKIIANGMQTQKIEPLIEKRCKWTESVSTKD